MMASVMDYMIGDILTIDSRYQGFVRWCMMTSQIIGDIADIFCDDMVIFDYFDSIVITIVFQTT